MTESFGQAGTIVNATMQEAYKSEYSAVGGNNSTTAGGANDLVGSQWDWDDDDRGMGMDIQSLLSEFGDFGDFFEDDVLAIGEVNLQETEKKRRRLWNYAYRGDSKCLFEIYNLFSLVGVKNMYSASSVETLLCCLHAASRNCRVTGSYVFSC